MIKKSNKILDLARVQKTLEGLESVKMFNSNMPLDEAVNASYEMLLRGYYCNSIKNKVYLDQYNKPCKAKDAVQVFEVTRNFVGANPQFLEKYLDDKKRKDDEIIFLEPDDDPFE